MNDSENFFPLVLVIENENLTIKILARLFDYHNIPFIHAGTLEKALEILKSETQIGAVALKGNLKEENNNGEIPDTADIARQMIEQNVPVFAMSHNGLHQRHFVSIGCILTTKETVVFQIRDHFSELNR